MAQMKEYIKDPKIELSDEEIVKLSDSQPIIVQNTGNQDARRNG